MGGFAAAFGSNQDEFGHAVAAAPSWNCVPSREVLSLGRNKEKKNMSLRFMTIAAALAVTTAAFAQAPARPRTAGSAGNW